MNLPAKQETWCIPGLGRSPGEGTGYPLQYSCLENPWTEEPSKLQSMGSEKIQTRLSNQTTLQNTTWKAQVLLWLLFVCLCLGLFSAIRFSGVPDALSNTMGWVVFPPLCMSFLISFGKLLHTEFTAEKTQKHRFAFQGEASLLARHWISMFFRFR